METAIIKFAYLSPKEIDETTYPAFGEDIQEKHSYGQTGYIFGIIFPYQNVSSYHMIDWKRSK